MRRPGIKLGAWLSLLAMLLLSAGPLIGQASAALRAMGSAPPLLLDAMHCGELSAQQQSSPAANPATEQHGLLQWDKCGYCTLLLQHPPLLESSPLSVSAAVAWPACIRPGALAQRTKAPIFPGARSRAPPPAID